MGCVIQDIRPLDIKRIQVKLGEYHYGVTVVGDGKPLVCLHGFSESGTTWDGIHVDGYRMIRIDLIGHGTSSRPTEVEAYTISQMILDIHRIVYALAGERYALLGYSMGARIALLYALQYPLEVTKLILESGSVGIEGTVERSERREADMALGKRIREQTIEWFAENWAKLDVFKSQYTLPNAVQHRIQQRRLQNSPHALAFTLEGSGQGVMPYVGHRLQELTMPVCYISGELDTKYTGIGRRYFEGVHHVVLGAGHNVHVEKPCQYMCIVKEFLDV
ncbi:2-succinyl-6-hydroxy-2,4-cyclohexadiene-1-carboxylate synthase [Veillonella sp. CHU110]|uniref:2-succinyl-6-hydroxy-2, 4-cyclohexadiene-1-carboxylate synthase n=1 Tax=Veillonella sp. CHU110 TaxID=2490947 RepID=UPI000F8C3AAC|nr:2-succinyl-6-hydroxy-2,4-cyclohexadiene-1-carboxylate synthase [Veillonella sp. CHU110]